jgi:hypothetical protein
MTNRQGMRIQNAELERDDGLMVTFSDGTTAGYVVEELLDLKPHREPNTPYTTKIQPPGSDAYFPTDLPRAIG